MVAIAIVASAWGPRFGGINAFNADLCRAVAAARPDLEVYCVTGGAQDSEVQEALSHGVQLVNLHERNFLAPDPRVLGEELADWSRTLVGLAWWIGHDVITGPAVVDAARRTGVRVAIVQHTDYASYGALKGTPGIAVVDRDWAESKTLAKADVLFGVGPKLASAALDRIRFENTDVQVTQIVPGLPDIATARTPPNTFRAVTYGRLDEQSDRIKQSRLAVRSFGELIGQVPDLVGLDPRISVIGLTTEQALDEQAELDLLADTQAGRLVEVVGHPFTEDRDRLFRVLADASVALMLSVHEGFGLVGWEAIAAEVPLVLSRNSGLYALLEQIGGSAVGCVRAVDVRGLRRPPYHTEDDVVTVARALREIAIDPSRAKNDARALKRLLTDYDWGRAATQFVDALALPMPTDRTRQTPKPGGNHAEAMPQATLPPRGDDELVGRAAQLARLEQMAQDGRSPLITLLGSPGSGKTRFVTELAHGLRDTFEDRVYFVDLSSIADPDLVAASISRALHIEARDPILNALRDFFRWNRALLVLDNFEQVTPAALALRELISGAPYLQVVVTSRQRLGVVGETSVTLDELTPDEALTLFRRRRGDDIQFGGDDSDLIRQICARVDHIPLAIELIAAHAQVYSSDELLDLLDDSALDIENTRQDVAGKQQSLRNAIDWSYGLLEPPDALMFEQLSVFTGGWTVTSASGVLANATRADRLIAAQIERLFDRSLIRRSSQRLNMFDTIRAYAAEKLEARGGAAELFQAHAEYFLRRLTGVVTEPTSRADWPGLTPLLADVENCTQALRWFADAGRRDDAALMAAMLGRMWWSTDLVGGLGHLGDIVADNGLRDVDAQSEVAVASLWRGRIALRLGRLDIASTSFDRVVEAAGRLSDGYLLATGESDAALVAMETGDYVSARRLLDHAAEWFTRNPSAEGHADVLDSLGILDTYDSRYASAAQRFDDAIRRYDDVHDRTGIGWVYIDQSALTLAQNLPFAALDLAQAAHQTGRELGDRVLQCWADHRATLAYLDLGNTQEARACGSRCASLLRLLGDQRLSILTLEAFAAIAAVEGRHPQALSFDEAARRHRDRSGIPRSPFETRIFGPRIERSAATLDAAAVAVARNVGRRWSLEHALTAAELD